MIIPSLLALAAKDISRGKIPLPPGLPSGFSNCVIQHSEEFPRYDYLKNLNPSEIRKEGFVFIEDFEAFSKFKLELLKLGSFTGNLFKCLQGQEHKSVVECLCNCLFKSRESLKYLKLGNLDFLQLYWLSTILEYFPNLHTLELNVNYYSSFPTLKREFFQVKYLDISNTSLPNLNGISNLPNLISLSMRNMAFGSSEGIDDIYSLKELENLDVSQRLSENEQEHNRPRNNIVYFLVERNKSLHKLKFLNCSYTNITNTILDRFLKLNQNVREIVLYKTAIHDVTRDRIKFSSTRDLSSALELLKRYNDVDPNNYSEHILKEINAFLKTKMPFHANEKLLRECLDVLLDKVEQLSNNHEADEENRWAFFSVFAFCKWYGRHLNPEKVQHVLSTMLGNETWDKTSLQILAEAEIMRSPGLDIAYLYQKTVNFFIQWSIFDLRYAVLTMIDALLLLHPMTTSVMRLGIRGEKQCVENLFAILRHFCSRLTHDQDLFISACERIERAINMITTESNLAYSEQAVLNVLDLVKTCEVASINRYLITSVEKLMYRMTHTALSEFAEVVDLEILINCLFENMNEGVLHEGNVYPFNRDLSFGAMRVLALLLLYYDEEVIEFRPKLRELAERHEYSYFCIPFMSFDEDGDDVDKEEGIYFQKADSLGSWVEKMMVEMDGRKRRTSDFNYALYERSKLDGNDSSFLTVRGFLLAER